MVILLLMEFASRLALVVLALTMESPTLAQLVLMFPALTLQATALLFPLLLEFQPPNRRMNGWPRPARARPGWWEQPLVLEFPKPALVLPFPNLKPVRKYFPPSPAHYYFHLA